MKYDISLERSANLPAFPYYSIGTTPSCRRKLKYAVLKRLTIDVTFSILAIPAICIASMILLILNPFFNPGPLFFRQARMGLDGKMFMLVKFRTMTVSEAGLRPLHTPVEQDRITILGQFLRRSRIDEWPNFLNVLKGEMSVVGPRPEAWEHALCLIEDIRYYRDRFSVLPGITGLAQVRSGYACCRRGVQRKARLDSIYADQIGFKLDLYIIAKTFKVIASGFGAK